MNFFDSSRKNKWLARMKIVRGTATRESFVLSFNGDFDGTEDEEKGGRVE